jgi:hypothetical protein
MSFNNCSQFDCTQNVPCAVGGQEEASEVGRVLTAQKDEGVDGKVRRNEANRKIKT